MVQLFWTKVGTAPLHLSSIWPIAILLRYLLAISYRSHLHCYVHLSPSLSRSLVIFMVTLACYLYCYVHGHLLQPSVICICRHHDVLLFIQQRDPSPPRQQIRLLLLPPPCLHRRVKLCVALQPLILLVHRDTNRLDESSMALDRPS